VAQTLEAQAELKLISATKWNMISAQSSKPNMAIVQDSLLGAYRMTQGTKKLSKGQFFDIAMKLARPPWLSSGELEGARSDLSNDMMSTQEILDRMQHIRRIMKEKGKKVQCFTGHGLISLFLPSDFNYEQRNDKNKDEPYVRIYKGVMYEGTLDKSNLGSAHNALHQVIHKEYGEDAAAYFIDCIQFVTNNYLLIDGFSVGLGDCLISQGTNEDGVTKEEQIRDVIQKCYVEAEGVKQTTVHPGIREIRITAALNKAKDIGLRIAKDALSPDNNFLSTVNSGSKGDFFNIAQITGLLGQQNLKGRRVPLQLNHGKRSLPHYPFGDLPPELEYESRGFIDCGFLRGLNPKQFYFHAMSGREGVCDREVTFARFACECPLELPTWWSLSVVS
jgi:DNA-directed RNA polymerase beta' subunit